ncbi:polymeric immunoglobulin receptor-like isoform X3 [Narcine bancroftii]|uniref:polymeric immunoglobulin receptor-like isoform X3 n=1 Tax=Narcine bancroftii TaxID=1343680 RepID=UPI0038310DFB
MKLIALLLLTVISNTVAFHSMVIRAEVGETMTVECPHTEKYGRAGWCKTYLPEMCKVVVSTNGEDHNGRTSIRRKKGSVFVTIFEVETIDSGIYWCGLRQADFIHISDTIMLEVFTADSWQPNKTTVNGEMGKAINIHCQYKKQHASYKKFLCKVASVNRCRIIASSSPSKNRKYDYNLVVTLHRIDEGDEGEYWCGATDTVHFEIGQVKILEVEGTSSQNITNINKSSVPIGYFLLPAVLVILLIILIPTLVKKWRQMCNISQTHYRSLWFQTSRFKKSSPPTRGCDPAEP